METAYLYVRVSTDEQKRKGYSLPEQEERLLKYCKFYNIEVKGIYREDFSAKNFNRPEWNRLFSEIKKKSSGEGKNILFIKWDRFSRNIEYAYEMIGKLRKYKTTAKAIDRKNQMEDNALVKIFQRFSEFETSDKRHLVNLIPPTDTDFKTGALSLDLNQSFLKILLKENN